MKTTERIHQARAAIENIREAYEFVQLGAYVGPQDAGYLAYQLCNLQDLITLAGEEIKSAFPWAHVGDDDIARAYAEAVEEFRGELEELEEEAPKRVHLRNILDVDNDALAHVVTYTVSEMYDEVQEDGYATVGQSVIHERRYTWNELDREDVSMDAIKRELVEMYDIDTNW